MFNIEMTINGKPLNEANMKDELEKAVVTIQHLLECPPIP
jgi:hypothetical protein